MSFIWSSRPRHASAGEDSLRLAPHGEEDSYRSSSTGGGGGGSVIHSNMVSAPPTSVRNSSRLNSFARIPNMDRPLEKEDATIGEAGTFRGPALARRWVNTSRRNLMKQQGQQRLH